MLLIVSVFAIILAIGYYPHHYVVRFQRTIVCGLFIGLAILLIIAHNMLRERAFSTEHIEKEICYEEKVAAFEVVQDTVIIFFENGDSEKIILGSGSNYEISFKVIDPNGKTLKKITSRRYIEDQPWWVQFLILPYERYETWQYLIE